MKHETGAGGGGYETLNVAYREQQTQYPRIELNFYFHANPRNSLRSIKYYSQYMIYLVSSLQ
jgi:hypothetical protein